MANTFERIEKKYLLTNNQYQELMKKIADYVEMDDYPMSCIHNIYYDTPSFDIIRESLEKPVYKEKLRLRSYGVPKDDSTVFLELKKKYDGVVYKRRISLKYEEAINYLEKGIYPKKDSQILREIDYFVKRHNLTNRTYLRYERLALRGKEDHQLRITFDSDITACFGRSSLQKGYKGDAVLEEGMVLMEIKVLGAMKLWLSRILSELEIYPTSISKYGKAYVQNQEYMNSAKESENRYA